jgi:protein ImuA
MFHNPRTRLDDLRDQIARIERGAPTGPDCPLGKTVSMGATAIDQTLPNEGLALGALHEIAGAGPDTEHGAAAALLAAGILARLTGPVLWAQQHADLFAPGLAGAGLHPDRVIFADAGKEVLATMEEGLRHPSLTAVVGEIAGRFSLIASRRLQLAAEQTGVLAIALRRSRQFDDPALREPTAAMTRWIVTALPSPPAMPHAPFVPGLGPARWRLALTRCRGGEPHEWITEACDATGHLRLVPDLADGPAAEMGQLRA